MIRTEKVRLYPNAIMKRHIDELCDYRRYCWNTGLALWNDMYDEAHIMDNKALMPTKYKVRNELVRNKADWQYSYSSRCLQLAIDDLGRAWKIFLTKLNPTGVSLNSNLKKHHVRVLRQIVQKSLMAN